MNARERHNAKARQSTAGQRKKGKRKAKPSLAKEANYDPNAELIVPKSEEQKELDRKERLRQELLEQQDSKVNSKKKKRLEKYIDKKLKQEERVALFEKLSKSQAHGTAALQLKSSATLGTGKVITHQDRVEKEEHQEVKRVMEGSSNGKKRRRSAKSYVGAASDSEEEPEAYMDDDHRSSPAVALDLEPGKTRANPVVIVDSGFATTKQEPEPAPAVNVSYIGSALKRAADGSIVAPRIVKRKTKSKTAFSSWKETSKAATVEAESDTSFDSSDSAYDSDSADEEDVLSKAESDSEADSDEESNAEAGDEMVAEQASASPPKKKLGFKDWALKQLSAAKGYVAPPIDEANPPSPPVVEETAPPLPKKRKVDHSQPGEMRGPLGKDLVLPATSFTKHLVETGKDSPRRKVVEIKRPLEVDEARIMLPIVAEEQPIMEAILLNSVVIICGETGSGKTTQVPQFLYEAGFGSPGSENPGMIGVTQPRRVAAMSMASRVAHELSLTSSKVSYQIRYDATVSPDTSIKFMTDGVLLRELATDFLLTKYSVIIIDEAHERSMNTDILIGVLSRVIKLREEMWVQKKDDVKPLRLIIMSATLRVSDFAENTTLFSTPPPIINVAARQHPVTVHFSRRTTSDYVTEAIKKASKIHSRLPPGGILIFLTGQNEIAGACKKLEARYGAKAIAERKRRRNASASTSRFMDASSGDARTTTVAPAQADVEAEDMELGTEPKDLALDVDGDNADVDMDDEALDTDDDLNNEELGIDTEESEVPMHIVPLYALLPSEKQMQVFKPPPEGHRLVVVSTNVAETSLTIPNIRYVIDCGRAKERRYDHENGVQSFQVSWISKASAAQRAGRAGRTGPGHCYRLYSSALFETYFEQFSQPEILRTPIEGVVLQMKSMHIDAVVNFPFPTPPDRLSLKKAETVLTHLGALSTPASNVAGGGEITDVGRTMSLFPLSPRFSRMLVSGRQHGCLPYVIAIVSALSVGDPFLREEALDQEEESDEEDEDLSHIRSEAARAKEARRLRRKAFFESQEIHASLGDHASDVFRILSVVGAYEYAGGGHKFCADHFVRPKAMEEIHKLRAQISSIVQTNFPDADAGFVPNLRPPSSLQLKVLRQLLTAGFIDQVAVRKDRAEKGAASGEQYTTARGVPYRALGIDEDVFIHPSSVLANQPPPEFVVFLEVVRSSKVFVKGLTVINPSWLSHLGRSLCTFSKPIQTKEGTAVVIPHFGPAGWELPPVKEGN
ncbi:ATP-dependent RNA helicase [Phanerochaete sordida]|uniref:RNA helicase n=1 Tax=Phanerochaete sordida TaxID=48140 RepID=A0A9P3L8X0_9APHY|nr:ATP-dependent RNA helicase [Phanerochaete sordida]